MKEKHKTETQLVLNTLVLAKKHDIPNYSFESANTEVFELLLLALSCQLPSETFKCIQKDKLHKKTIIEMSRCVKQE